MRSGCAWGAGPTQIICGGERERSRVANNKNRHSEPTLYLYPVAWRPGCRGRKRFAVTLIALADCPHIVFRAWKIDLREEGRAVGRGGAFHPAQRVAPPGIVVGERVGDRVVRLRITKEQLAQIPRPGLRVG